MPLDMLTIDDHKVFVTGSDIDGIPRGKILLRSKFEKAKGDAGFGFCDVIFKWDFHDSTYLPNTPNMNAKGFSDMIAKIDIKTLRRDPLTGICHFLVDFYNPATNLPLEYCPRSLLQTVLSRQHNFKALTGVEFEFYNFLETQDSLFQKKGQGLTPLTYGNFGYSTARPSVHQSYFDDIFDKSLQFGIPLECYHTETGPGVYEAALEYCETLELADRAHLFKMLTKKIGTQYGIVPSFMAKPHGNLPGCSGHLHFSLQDCNGGNIFADSSDPQKISSTLRYFVAGILKGLPSIMSLLAPTINSYKRLNESYWAPITVSYGYECRISAIRIITPPSCSPEATRIEIRVPGADINCYLACAAIVGCGYFGIENKIELPPLNDSFMCELLPNTLRKAVDQLKKHDSIARKVLGNVFVDHYAATREHEIRLWDLAITNWEVQRYLEVV